MPDEFKTIIKFLLLFYSLLITMVAEANVARLVHLIY